MNIQANIGLIEQVSATLRDMMGDDFDADTFWDSLDGESDAMDMIGHLITSRVEAKSYEAGAKDAAALFTARVQRMATKQKAISAALGRILDATGETKVAHPLGTVSRTKARVSAQVTDEASIPSQLTVTTTRPDMAAIKAQLEAGEIVPGAELVAGEPGLTVRVK